MSLWTTWRVYRRRLGTQWLEPDELRRLQETGLRRLVEHAVSTVPYYRDLFAQAGLSPADVRTLDDLRRVPVTTKADLQARPADDVTSGAFPPARLVGERTSGSSGRPFEMRFDRRFVAVRNALFLRALTVTGYRPGRPALLLTGHPQRTRRSLRWRYAAMEAAPEQLADALNEHRPWLLYGPVTPLRQLARHVEGGSADVHRPKVVIATAEALDGATRRLLAETLDAEVYDFYGLTETGVLAWECPEHDGLHIGEDSVITELEPADTGAGSEDARLVVTNLELRAMPLIRYATGDLVRPGPPGRCGCGRHLTRLAAVSGRAVDCVRRAGGRTVSPYRVTLALEGVSGLRRYQVVQEGLERFTLRYESADAAIAVVEDAARMALQRVLGPGAIVSVRRDESLDPPPGRKFKVVECRLEEGSTQ